MYERHTAFLQDQDFIELVSAMAISSFYFILPTFRIKNKI